LGRANEAHREGHETQNVHGDDKQTMDKRSSHPSIRGVSLGEIDPRENALRRITRVALLRTKHPGRYRIRYNVVDKYEAIRQTANPGAQEQRQSRKERRKRVCP